MDRIGATLVFTFLFLLVGCAMKPASDGNADDFRVMETRPGRVLEKTEYASDEQWQKSTRSQSQMPIGWTSRNFLMDGVITYLHTSMLGTTYSARSGSTYGYLVELPGQERIRVLSKYSGFDVGECVNILFGESAVRIACGDKCP